MIQHKIPVKKILAILNICLLTAVLLHSILRDIQLEKHYCRDIRNRVVGPVYKKTANCHTSITEPAPMDSATMISST
ncbi:MAG: hypothetical protein Q8918_00370 [Bacteroidota bacterium]|nr:hypothetical protein [Bacteroidota bacterium]MDP4211870.1 hypothetical protein [Bacteroidota bacterium]MDP4248541.1 hypothetical protein [Bacteroidota bacterium]